MGDFGSRHSKTPSKLIDPDETEFLEFLDRLVNGEQPPVESTSDCSSDDEEANLLKTRIKTMLGRKKRKAVLANESAARLAKRGKQKVRRIDSAKPRSRMQFKHKSIRPKKKARHMGQQPNQVKTIMPVQRKMVKKSAPRMKRMD